MSSALEALKQKASSLQIVEVGDVALNDSNNPHLTIYVQGMGMSKPVHRHLTDWSDDQQGEKEGATFNGFTAEELNLICDEDGDITDFGMELLADVPVKPYTWENNEGEEVTTTSRSIVKFTRESRKEAFSSYGLELPEQEGNATEIGDEQPVGEEKVKQQA